MAISSPKNSAKPAQAVQLEEDRIEKDLSSSKVIETRVVVDIDTSILKTKQYIEGSDWEVTYYNQLASKSDTIGSLDASIDTVEQQYVKIESLNIKTTSFIPSDKMTEITGEASIIEFLPIVGDMFAATLIGDIDAVFTVTEVRNKSYNLDRIYDIAFRLDSTEITNPDKVRILEQRTVRVLHYDKEATFSGTDPLLLSDDAEFKSQLETTFMHIADRYVDDFKMLSKRNFLIAEVDGITILDQNVTYLFNQMSDRRYGVDFVIDDTYKSTIIDIAINDTKEYLRDASHPKLVPPPTAINFGNRFRGLIGLSVSYVSSAENSSEESFIIKPTHSTLPSFKSSDSSYLFTRDFYDSKSGLSLIEELLTDAINWKQIEPEKLKALMEAHYDYTTYEKYLYVPFILFIMKSFIYRMYSKG